VGSFSIFDASQSPPSLVGQIANNSALYFAEGVWVLNDKYAVVAVVGREASYITAWDGA
jgi:hypothetical protein